MEKITLKDIAKSAGVSQQTVSKVLNNRNFTVSTATRDRIIAVAKELNYRPNYFARSLKTGRTGIIGIICGVGEFLGFNDPFLTGILSGITKYCHKHDYKIMSHSFEGLRAYSRDLEMAHQQMVDGLIFVLFSNQLEAFKEDNMELLSKLSIPYTVIHSTGRNIGCNNIGFNSIQAGRMATEHLLSHSFPTIGLVRESGDRHKHIEELSRGYKNALAAKGMEPDAAFTYYPSGNGAPAGYELADTLIREKMKLPRALFCTDDYNAQGMMARFEKEGLKIPGDIALAGFGDEIGSSYIINRLTSIHQCTDAKGRLAAEMLLDRINNPDHKTEPDFRLLEPELITRSSCGCSNEIK